MALAPDQLARNLVVELTACSQTLATAESLTGGLLGATITAVSGASAVYLGGAITYATAMKHVLADVPDAVLGAHGPVARETAVAMASGIRARTGSTWALATTGVAGPDTQDGHPVGEVWIALSGPDATQAFERHFPGGRPEIRRAAVAAALQVLAAQLGIVEPHL